MKITNNYNMPETIVEAVKVWTYAPKEHSIGVSALTGPPLVRFLQRKHWHEMEEDASDRLWALLGQSVHSVLDKVNIEETLTEEKLTIPIEGYDIVLSGRIDLYKGITKSVEDYKVTSAYSFLLGEKIEWEDALNVYAYLYRQTGFTVESLKIHAILRDWMRSKAKQDAKYPQIPFHTAIIPLWDEAKQKEYIYNRIAEHMTIPVRDCTDNEKWYRGDTFAVKKIGNKRALRVFDTAEEAGSFLATQKVNCAVEARKGAYTRCLDYCSVRKFCDFAKNLNEGENEENGTQKAE